MPVTRKRLSQDVLQAMCFGVVYVAVLFLWLDKQPIIPRWMIYGNASFHRTRAHYVFESVEEVFSQLKARYRVFRPRPRDGGGAGVWFYTHMRSYLPDTTVH